MMSRYAQVKQAKQVLMLEEKFYRINFEQYEKLEELGLVGGRLELLNGELGRDNYVVRFDTDELQTMYQHNLIEATTEFELINGMLYHSTPRNKNQQKELGKLASIFEQALGEHVIVHQRKRLILSAQNALIAHLIVQRKPKTRFAPREPSIGDTILLIDFGADRPESEEEIRLNTYAKYGLSEVWWLKPNQTFKVHRDTVHQSWGSVFHASTDKPLAPLEFPDAQIRWW